MEISSAWRKDSIMSLEGTEVRLEGDSYLNWVICMDGANKMYVKAED